MQGKICAIALAAIGLFACGANASVIFSGSSGSRAASAEFDTSGGSLTVRLTNTSGADVMVPVDVLTAVFFDISGPAVSLSRTSAVLGAGSFVTNGGGTDPGNVVGGEWAYNFRAGGFSGGGAGSRHYGISSSGLGDFGPGDRFPGSDLSPPASPDGLQYGITSAGDNPATGNGGVNTPLIKNQVFFTLAGLPSGFDLSRIGNVLFVYGTAYGEGELEVPAPSALALLGLGGLAASRRRR